MNGRFEAAAVAIFVAMIFDGLDGRVARMTNTQSEFGAEYDSMADMVSFGVAPAIVAYNWGLTQIGIADSRYFQGLASPAAAALVAGMIWVGVEYNINGQDYGIIVAIVTGLAGLLMVSNFKYNSFKELNLHGKVPFVALLLIMLVFVVVATEPALVLFIVFALYSLAGPINTFRTVDKLRIEDVVGDAKEPDEKCEPDVDNKKEDK
jgi:CDP-diacylglycerol--serine O-phosphatidyltransferase